MAIVQLSSACIPEDTGDLEEGAAEEGAAGADGRDCSADHFMEGLVG
jgi:hypothetical protein